MKPISACIGPDVGGVSYFRYHVSTQDSDDIGHLPVDLTPLPGSALDLDIEGYRSDRVSIWMSSSATGYQTQPREDFDAFVLRIPYTGEILRREKAQDFVVKPGSAILRPLDRQGIFITSQNVSVLSCAIDRAALMACHQTLTADGGLYELPDFTPVVPLVSAPMLALKRTIELLRSAQQSEADLVFPLVEEMLLFQLVGAWPLLDTGAPSPSASANSAMGRAIDFIDSHLTTPITISQVAAAAGVGIRTLQKVFKDNLGCSPAQYVINRRLEHVHRDLADSNDCASVSKIAVRWGFTHMSDFARRYKGRYGTLPSVTMRRNAYDR